MDDERLPQKLVFPQIFSTDNEEYIGGYAELVDWIKPTFDYQKVKDLAKILTYNLNKIIDYNFYPIPETERSNRRHRPIGLGVQGLANVFYEMKTEFGAEESKDINRKIFESIYYGYFKHLWKLLEIEKKILRLLKQESILLIHIIVKILFQDDILRRLNKKLRPIDGEIQRDEYLGTYSTYINSPSS